MENQTGQSTLKLDKKLSRNQWLMVVTVSAMLGLMLAAVVSSVGGSSMLEELTEKNIEQAIIESEIGGKKVEVLRLQTELKDAETELSALRAQRESLNDEINDIINAPAGLTASL